jgi:hypothetical protein
MASIGWSQASDRTRVRLAGSDGAGRDVVAIEPALLDGSPRTRAAPSRSCKQREVIQRSCSAAVLDNARRQLSESEVSRCSRREGAPRDRCGGITVGYEDVSISDWLRIKLGGRRKSKEVLNFLRVRWSDTAPSVSGLSQCTCPPTIRMEIAANKYVGVKSMLGAIDSCHGFAPPIITAVGTPPWQNGAHGRRS